MLPAPAPALAARQQPTSAEHAPCASELELGGLKQVEEPAPRTSEVELGGLQQVEQQVEEQGLVKKVELAVWAERQSGRGRSITQGSTEGHGKGGPVALAVALQVVLDLRQGFAECL